MKNRNGITKKHPKNRTIMNTIITLIGLLLLQVSGKAQVLETLSAAGEHFTGSAAQISWTLGSPLQKPTRVVITN